MPLRAGRPADDGSGGVASVSMSGIDFDPRSALVVVDVQNDFADREGSLYVQGGEQVVPLVNQLVAAAHEAGATVVHTQNTAMNDSTRPAVRGGNLEPPS